MKIFWQINSKVENSTQWEQHKKENKSDIEAECCVIRVGTWGSNIFGNPLKLVKRLQISDHHLLYIFIKFTQGHSKVTFKVIPETWIGERHSARRDHRIFDTIFKRQYNRQNSRGQKPHLTVLNAIWVMSHNFRGNIKVTIRKFSLKINI